MVKQQIKQKRPSLHHLLAAVSYNGCITRTILVAVFAAMFILSALFLMENDSNRLLYLTGLQGFTTVVIGFFIFDFFYVTIANRYGLHPFADKAMLFIVEISYLIFLLSPYIAPQSIAASPTTALIILLSPLFILSLRVLLGIAGAKR